MRLDQPSVVRLDVTEPGSLPPDRWPLTVPAVAQFVAKGLPLAPGVTFLVGDNGSGKSTLVEAAAAAYGLSPEGGTIHGQHSTRATESPLGSLVHAQRGVGTRRWGFFLRAETMHSWYTFSEQLGGPRFHELSHGESFLAVVRHYLTGPGFYVLDEPEAALSFEGTMGLMVTLTDVVAAGGQVLCATHSPILAALPGATLLEVGDWGLREASWDDLDLVRHWKTFFASPQNYLRHLAD
ncbi:ATP-binding cassette domain-containing protein [Nocardioides jishulii]|uniref:ATP-binding cassette domain-containing protein n=1 Tax=Nocardioides jishulii TaxID=2575440 RepID=A0A4V5TK17_9ACTN|nr:ATP-binding cassette domain-containing protein [Nocardioides jishulii]QCX27306.1 ATP-binding cassette domain-containing protein [Nocardioides jishulii]TKI61793.1 ATP-binding cassette domain-containing protein [Nocardioides jishulii]